MTYCTNSSQWDHTNPRIYLRNDNFTQVIIYPIIESTAVFATTNIQYAKSPRLLIGIEDLGLAGDLTYGLASGTHAPRAKPSDTTIPLHICLDV